VRQACHSRACLCHLRGVRRRNEASISPHKRGAERLPILRNGRGRSVPRSPLSWEVALSHDFAGSPGEAIKHGFIPPLDGRESRSHFDALPLRCLSAASAVGGVSIPASKTAPHPTGSRRSTSPQGGGMSPPDSPKMAPSLPERA
jgi:hypothetical protein